MRTYLIILGTFAFLIISLIFILKRERKQFNAASVKLKCCPFCGSQPEFENGKYEESVKCRPCGISCTCHFYGGKANPERAFKLWNTRAPTQKDAEDKA